MQCGLCVISALFIIKQMSCTVIKPFGHLGLGKIQVSQGISLITSTFIMQAKKALINDQTGQMPMLIFTDTFLLSSNCKKKNEKS